MARKPNTETSTATSEGKNGGQFYTPSCVVRCLVEPVPARKDLAPYEGRIYDPACGPGGMFVQSETSGESRGGTAMRDSAKPNSEASLRELCEAKHHRGDISSYGQESNAATFSLELHSPLEKGELTARMHLGALPGQFLPNYGIPT